jgi:hypothetical protein
MSKTCPGNKVAKNRCTLTLLSTFESNAACQDDEIELLGNVSAAGFETADHKGNTLDNSPGGKNAEH